MHPLPSEGAVARSLPICLGTPERFHALRSALQQLQYDEASICSRTGVASIFDFKSKVEGRNTGREVNDPLDALIHLLMDGETMAADQVSSLLPAGLVATLTDLGVLGSVPNQPDQRYGRVHLYPVHGLYVVSDRTMRIEGGDGEMVSDSVYPAITVNTQRFLSALPETPCESLLDLCAGTGIAGMIGASSYAKHAWACDLVERSVRFAEFNRALNGIENLTCAQGDLYQPVGDLTFDRIVAHPPYVAAAEQKVLFRDGGQDGEQILRGVIEGLPRYLRPGGRCYCVTMATDREGETFQQRIRRWLGAHESEFDVVLVGFSVETKPEYVLQVMKGKNLRLLQLGPRNELLEQLKATAVYHGAVVIERMAAMRPAATGRTLKSMRAGSEAIEWFQHWTTASAAPDFDDFLLSARPHLAAALHLNVTHTVENGALTPSRFEVVSDYPFKFEAECPNWLAVVMGTFDGKRTTLEVYEEMKRQDVIHPATTPEQFLRTIRELLSQGLLELNEFRLPEPAAAAAVTP